MMTPEQKLKWAIVDKAKAWSGEDRPPYPCENVDELYQALEDADKHWDAKSETRCGTVETGIRCSLSRHYESKAVAMRFPDGSWVGWTYWFGGGKHGEPEAIDWMEDAYELQCEERQEMVTIRTFKPTETIGS